MIRLRFEPPARALTFEHTIHASGMRMPLLGVAAASADGFERRRFAAGTEKPATTAVETGVDLAHLIGETL
jgi:hypothetical protein